MTDIPTLDQIDAARARLGDRVVKTPVHHWRGREIEDAMDPDTEIVLKLECFQLTGTFKPRGALTVMLDLSRDALDRGVTTLSAGNHAIAAAYAAQILGSHAKVVMPRTASPARVAIARSYGAEVVLVDDVQQASERVQQIESEEGRTFVHPFEGPLTALGTASLVAHANGEGKGVFLQLGIGGLVVGGLTGVGGGLLWLESSLRTGPWLFSRAPPREGPAAAIGASLSFEF